MFGLRSPCLAFAVYCAGRVTAENPTILPGAPPFAVFTQHSGLLEKVQAMFRREAISFVSITGSMNLPQR